MQAFNRTSSENFPSFHLIQGLDLITDLSWTTFAAAVQSLFLPSLLVKFT